jgi:hypothetical protein
LYSTNTPNNKNINTNASWFSRWKWATDSKFLLIQK